MTAPGRPRPGVLVLDAVRGAVAHPAASLTTSLVVAVVCVVVLATTGRAAATEAQVLASVDSLGTRLISVTDTTGSSRIDTSAVDVLAGLDGVAWVFGLGPASDAVNPATGRVAGTTVTGRDLVGDLPDELPVTRGRTPSPGEAVVGAGAARALGLADVAGTVDLGTTRTGVVGQIEAGGPLAALDDTVLRRADDADVPIRYLYLRAAADVDVDALAAAVRAAVPAGVPATVDVEVSAGALALRQVLSGTLGASSRQLMAIVLGTGLALVAITVLGGVTARRRDFGRQRALGASRSTIVVTVLVQSALSAVVGVGCGLTVGLGLTHALTGGTPTGRFVVGLGVLTTLVTLAGSVPPALAAAWRDPLRVLRVP